MLTIVALFAAPMAGDVQLLIGEGTGTLEIWSAARRLEAEAARLLAEGVELEGRGDVVELEGGGGLQVRLSPEDVVISVMWEARGREPVVDYLASAAATPDHLYVVARSLDEWCCFTIWNARYERRLADLAVANKADSGDEASARDAIVRASRLPNLERMGTD